MELLDEARYIIKEGRRKKSDSYEKMDRPFALELEETEIGSVIFIATHKDGIKPVGYGIKILDIVIKDMRKPDKTHIIYAKSPADKLVDRVDATFARYGRFPKMERSMSDFVWTELTF